MKTIQVGNLTIVDIPKFVADLAMALNDAGQDRKSVV